MSNEVKEKEPEEPVATIKQKCVKCLKGTNLLKTLVVLICTIVVVQQISSCVEKLIKVPITTYAHFDFNKTIMYPSITFCREPPYKYDKLLEYGVYAHPRYTSTWANFNFSAISLDEMWDDVTYDTDDFFMQYGFNGAMDKLEVRPTLGFVQGRCLTLVPKEPSTTPTRGTGYTITLQHSTQDIATSTGLYPPGYHMYVHYSKEPYTEVEVYNGGLVDYLFINTGETVDVKLSVDQYKMINEEDNPCSEDNNYSANECTTQFVWDTVGEEVGCSGPWMNSSLSRCDNYTSMRQLISSYINNYQGHHCTVCPRICRAFLYKAFVADRQHLYTWDQQRCRWSIRMGEALLQSQVYIHFNSMMVSVYEERYNYDWNIFVSDLGGSVGFLLGLSVIGLMSMFEKVWSTIVKPFIRQPKNKGTSVISSNSITRIDENQRDVLRSDLFKKCNDGNIKSFANDYF